jgi:hypothetical protein
MKVLPFFLILAQALPWFDPKLSLHQQTIERQA